MFLYPETANVTSWLNKYNRLARTGNFHAGRFGLALDVWRDGQHMYRNYDLADSETLDEWCRRNYPTVSAPDYAQCGMGVPLVHGLDQHPVPKRAACIGHYSLSAVRLILQAALATGQYPFPPDNPHIVPQANALRQRMVNTDQDWLKINVADVESQVAIRAIVLNKGSAKPVERMATYVAELQRREGSTLESKLEESEVEVRAPDADLSETDTRRPILKAAKEAVGIIGRTGRVTLANKSGCRFALAAHPFDLMVRKVFIDDDIPTPDEGTIDL